MRRDLLLVVLSIVLLCYPDTGRGTIFRYLLYAFFSGTVIAIGAIVLVSFANFRAKDLTISQPILKPAAAFLTAKSFGQGKHWPRPNSRHIQKQLFESSQVSKSINELLEWISRDFVSPWYRHISPSSLFPDQIDSALRAALLDIVNRLNSQDVVQVVVSRLVPIITDHLHDFYKAEHAIRGKKLNRNVTESEELDLAIAAKYRNGKIHPAASLSFSNTKMAQQNYLREMVVRLMQHILPYEMMQSRAVSTLIREISSCSILAPITQSISDPDFWNQIIEAYGKTMLQDRKTVRKLRAALDERASPAPKIPKKNTFPRLSPLDDERKFERFIRAIRCCNNISEARRYRSEITSQLRRESMLEAQDNIYLRRLETAKRILDQRVDQLSNIGGAMKSTRSSVNSNITNALQMTTASLRDILHDSLGLSYFMEYMDRQHLMTMVQFWIVVEGIRDPLESDGAEENAPLQTSVRWRESDRQDIAQISDAYLQKSEIDVTLEARDVVHDFLKAGRAATLLEYSEARNAILRSQNTVLERMQMDHLPGFRRSDLYYKLLTSDDVAGRSTEKGLSRKQEAQSATVASHRAPSSDRLSGLVRQGNGSISTLSRKPSFRGHFNQLAGAAYEDSTVSGQSVDLGAPRPLFNDDIKGEPTTLLASNYDLRGVIHDDGGGSQDQMVEAVEAELTQIISGPDCGSGEILSGIPEDGDSSSKDVDGYERSGDDRRMYGPQENMREKPNLASLGLVNTSSRIGVFTDNDLFGDEDRFLEDEHADPEDRPDKKAEEEIHEADPGDLGLAEAISALTIDIDRLIAQDTIVATLTKKAELTNNIAELRILAKSKASLQRELRRKELQRQQYIVQESDNSLYGRASVKIKSIMVGKEDDGQEYALYVVEVQRRAGEHMSAASWAVARRFSEFHDLHQRLRQAYAAVRQLEFPRRRLVMKLQRDFLDKRRASLESYLRQLVLLPAVCKSRDLRAFLSHRPIISGGESEQDGGRADIVSRIYSSVADGMDEFLGNVPALDQLSIAGQNLISAATSQFYGSMTTTSTREADSPGIVATKEERAELESLDNQALEPFVKPICDLFLEIFELNQSQNWLRGRAAVIVLHQLLGGIVERKMREASDAALSEAKLLGYLSTVKEVMWPNGTLRVSRKPRSLAERNDTRREASLVLSTLVPELAGGIVGRTNAQAAGRRVFAAVNNARLNDHLVFCLLDETFAVLLNEEPNKS